MDSSLTVSPPRGVGSGGSGRGLVRANIQQQMMMMTMTMKMTTCLPAFSPLLIFFDRPRVGKSIRQFIALLAGTRVLGTRTVLRQKKRSRQCCPPSSCSSSSALATHYGPCIVIQSLYFFAPFCRLARRECMRRTAQECKALAHG